MERVSAGDGVAGEPIDGVHLELLAAGERMNAQTFELEPGAEVPVHSHPHEQVGMVTEGTITFLVDDEEVDCGPGDTYAIPGGEPHGARNDGDTTVFGVEMFSPLRENPTWRSDDG